MSTHTPRCHRPGQLLLGGGFLLAALLLPLPAAAEVVIPVDNETDFAIALGSVGPGEIIELAAGTYFAPANGWGVSNPSASFTIRGAAGASVTLDGGGSEPILKLSLFDPGVSIVLQNLTFANGSSDTDGIGGGVTLNDGRATFIDCQLIANESVAATTGGGGVFVFGGSTAHFFATRFDGNLAQNEGAGLKIGGQSTVSIHDSELVANRTNVPGHRSSAAGAGIHVTSSSKLSISNTRFDSNEGACFGGALYVLGSFDDPPTEVTVTNSTFVDNVMAPITSCAAAGAAMQVEKNVVVKVYNSRFLTNTSLKAGAINAERCTLEIYDSIFRGNLASGDDTSWGGAIASNSGDAVGDDVNFPSAVITIHDSLFQGRFGSVGATAKNGGCLWVLGDTRRSYGVAGVPPMGGPEENRARLDIERSVFFDCDAEESTATGTGRGGAMELNHVDLTLLDSLILDSDAVGTGSRGTGGGIWMTNESLAVITGSTFANNTATFRAGGIQATGSDLTVDDCRFFLNEDPNGGGAINTSVTGNGPGGRDFSALGEVKNSIFSNQASLTLREIDADNATCEINEVVYNNNRFYTSPADGDVFRNSLTGGSITADELNDLTVVRANCADTVKSTIDNVALAGEPDLTALVAVPAQILPANAAGDPPPPTESFLGFAWDGSPATLDGDPLAAGTGIEAAASGVHTLVAGTSSAVAEITDGPNPAASFAAVPIFISNGETSDLVWSTLAGTFLDVSIDRGVIATPAPSGAVTVMPIATERYSLHLMTEEGGARGAAAVFVDELPGEPIFIDGFESGDTSAWAQTVP